MDSATDRILDYFEQINAIPRCSGNEAGVAAWLKIWAAQRGFACQEDDVGNVVIRVPGGSGRADAPTIILQGHMDMVCEKTPDSPHDFSRDPIRSHREGEWLKADRTTLGADNGIAIAYALAVAEDPRVARPPLELLCTVDEESGLTGVMKMGPDMIRGKTLINIDSEDEGVFTIGCSGGREVRLRLALETLPGPADGMHYTVSVGGLTGGHSGIDIGKSRASANRLMARTLTAIGREIPELRLTSLSGGSRHNAIARDARAVILVPRAAKEVLEGTMARMAATLRAEHTVTDPALAIEISPARANDNLFCGPAATRRLTHLLLALPHGALGMSAGMPGLVESSCNLAVVAVDQGRADIVISLRSSMVSRLDEMAAQVLAIAGLAGAEALESKGYPPWIPQSDSLLLRRARKAYRRLFEKDPVDQVIHAGLECAIIGGLYPGMEMISIGPTIRNPHSPDERLYVPSVERVWRFLVALLEEYGQPAG
jgi:dipeptidase D